MVTDSASHQRSLRVTETGDSSHEGDSRVVRLGREIAVSGHLLEQYCFANPDAAGHDLMTLVGAVKYADRAFRRHYREGWARSIKVQVPVFEKDRWTDKAVLNPLIDCLTHLTGDDWKFSFTRRKQWPPAQAHLMELKHQGEHIFVPYSHGLDSFAQVQLLDDPEITPLCVFTSSKGINKTWKGLCRDTARTELQVIPVPVELQQIDHPEPTFRSRPFIYYSLTAYGALLAGFNRVMIPENGQGSLGGSLVTMGYEAKHRSCHPLFTKKLGAFLEKATGKAIAFEHPALFKTKAQVLGELAAKRADTREWLLEHWSCSQDSRHSSFDHKHVHCGVCGNCLLRRVSVFAAGLTDPTEYLFDDLSHSTIEESGIREVKAIRSFWDIAGNGIRSMQRLADFADRPSDPVIWTEVAAVSRATNASASRIHEQMMEMLGRHKREWSAFLETCGDNSWVSQIARE